MKRFFSLITIICLLFSCSEKSLEIPGTLPPAAGGSGGTTTPTAPVAVGTVTFDLDGVAQNYSAFTRAELVKNPTGPGGAIGILGVKDLSATSQVTIYLYSDSAFKPGTYVDSASSTGNFAGLMFKNATGTYGTNDDSTAPSTCVISSVSATAIAGTFKGSVDLSNADGTFGKRLYITNGKFNVKFP